MEHALKANGQLKKGIDWKSAAWAGLMAGLAFMMVEMGMVWLVQGESPWGPPHMIAAMALGSNVLPPSGTWAHFDTKIMMTAMMIHLPLSVAYGLLGAVLIRNSEWVRALIVGAVMGLAIYIVNFYIIAPLTFPWFVMGRNWIGAVSHIMFGLAFGIGYVMLRKHKAVRAIQ